MCRSQEDGGDNYFRQRKYHMEIPENGRSKANSKVFNKSNIFQYRKQESVNHDREMALYNTCFQTEKKLFTLWKAGFLVSIL